MSETFCVNWHNAVSDPVWILDRVALAAHLRQLSEHGGWRTGFDPGRLAEALAWPRRIYSAINGSQRTEELAAAYAEAVIKLQPFEEGNIRTAFLLAILFLRLNGILLPAQPKEKLSAISRLARGKISRAVFAEWITLRQLANANPGKAVVKIRVANNKITQVSILNP